MVNLIYSVGTTNKFSNLNMDGDSSDEENTKIKKDVISTNEDKIDLKNAASQHINRNNENIKMEKQNGIQEKVDAAKYTVIGGTNKNKNKTKIASTNAGRSNDDTIEMNGSRDRSKGRSEGAAAGNKGKGAREHDRHSNTGRGREMKKEGGGRHNWGSDANWSSQSEKVVAVDEKEGKEVEVKESVEAEAVEVVEGTPQTEEEAVEKKEEEPVMMDFSEWKAQQAAKRLSVATAVQKTVAMNVKSIKEFEAQGFTPYVKEGVVARVEDQKEAAMQDGGDDENDARKKKTVNVYEYLYTGKGDVELFPGYRGRGRRGGRGGRGDRGDRSEKNKAFEYKGRDAPNLQDSRAFPALSDTKIVS